jgi:hypothetical protein
MQQRRPRLDGPSDPTKLAFLRQHSAAFPPLVGPDPRRALAHLGSARRDRERAAELALRDAAHRSLAPAPPSLTASVRESLRRASIVPAPPQTIEQVSLAARFIAEARARSQVVVLVRDLSGRQRRAAGTLELALCFTLGVVLDPGVLFAALGILSAVVLSALAVGHLLSAAVVALMGSTLLAAVTTVMFVGLAALWINLVRRPLEA